jgi:hypothetical protein
VKLREESHNGYNRASHGNEIGRKHDILSDVMQRLLSHRNETWKHPLEEQYPFSLVGLRRGDSSKDNLKKLLVFSLQFRGGPRLSLNEINESLSDFDGAYDSITKKLLPNFNGKETADSIYRCITSPNVREVGSKIAGVFLRDVVYRLGVWQELLNYLYLPIDRHIRSLLIKRLKVFDDKEVPKVSESFFTKKNQRFQAELAQIHTPRVDFDDLWFIGSQFCSYRKLCPLCWIRDMCLNRFEDDMVLSLQ